MRHLMLLSLITTIFITGCSTTPVKVNQPIKIEQQTAAPDKDTLYVLWTSGDPDVAHKVSFMYTHAAKKAKWFENVELIVWGPSSKLLANDVKLQKKIKSMLNSGIAIKACKACADSYNVSGRLSELDIEVKYMGQPLTKILKNKGCLISF